MRLWLIALLLVLCVVPDAGAQRARGAIRQGLVKDGNEEILQVDNYYNDLLTGIPREVLINQLKIMFPVDML